ncbi:MAG: hypothetical protein Q8O86_13015 [Dehalococcoidia bacterium]|mgnify:CR=1 FL=1|nr:hypothetical protein [Dehalococcoidia bacterium]
MIIRILSEGQYRLDSSHLDQLNVLDNQLVQVVAAGDEAQYRSLFVQMLALVRDKGTRVPTEEILESEIILPPQDTTLKEAQGLFIGAGLVHG